MKIQASLWQRCCISFSIARAVQRCHFCTSCGRDSQAHYGRGEYSDFCIYYAEGDGFRRAGYSIIDGLYYANFMIPSDGYKPQVAAGWLSLLVNAGEGIDVDIFLNKEPKEKVQFQLGRQIRINRSKMKEHRTQIRISTIWIPQYVPDIT